MNDSKYLQPQQSERGFTHMPPVRDIYGTEIKVFESSMATSPHLRMSVGDDREGSNAHLTLEAAIQLRDQLTYLIENHYQLREDPS